MLSSAWVVCLVLLIFCRSVILKGLSPALMCLTPKQDYQIQLKFILLAGKRVIKGTIEKLIKTAFRSNVTKSDLPVTRCFQNHGFFLISDTDTVAQR